MTKDIGEFIPYGEVHEIQINEKEMYAIEPVICDAIYAHEEAIADFRKKLALYPDYLDQIQLLASIQSREGAKVILKSILEQMGSSWER